VATPTPPVTLTAATIGQLSRVLPAAATGTLARQYPMLAGVYLCGRRILATDARRFAVAEVDQDLPELLLAARQVSPAVRAAQRADGGQLELTVGSDPPTIRQTTTGRTWPVTVLAGVYPDPATLLARLRTEGLVEVDTAALRAAVHPLAQALTGSGRRSEPLPLALRPTPDRLTLAAQTGHTTWQVELPARCTITEPIGLNPTYLVDALAGVTATTAQIHVGGGRRALHLHDDGLIHAVLPCPLPIIHAQEAAA
jgi:hypothetical protein